MYGKIKKKVYEANLKLIEYNLVIFTWGNVSYFDRENDIICIKPSGVEYDKMLVSDMVIVNLDGEIIEGDLKPSSDLQTHLEIYKNFPQVNSVCHTHSKYATSFAQAKKSIQCFGTTHADYFYGKIMCTRDLTKEEVGFNYEHNTGKVICETYKANKVDILSNPGILVANHGPFTVGKDYFDCVCNAKYLEEVAHMAINSIQIDNEIEAAPQYLQDKHYFRKHGENSYYGQRGKIR